LFYHLSDIFSRSQVECKKAQPKEVMLPANLAKTRTAGRGTYGELVVLSGGPSGSLGASGQAIRYTPYPLPATLTAAAAGHQQQAATTTHILNPTSIIQYTPATAVGAHQSSLYDTAAALSYKRLLAATAAASLRSQHRPTATTLTYPLGDLLGVQGLDLAGLYQIPTGTIGL
jgi:hypothetical protein